MAAGYGESAVEPRLRPSSGLSGVLSDVCVARQYASKYSARCSQASSNWFSSRIMSNISWGGKEREESRKVMLHGNFFQHQSSVEAAERH